jgi:hypothetical protein
VSEAQRLISGNAFGNLPLRVALADAVVTAAEGTVTDSGVRFAAAVDGLHRGGRVWLEADAWVQWGRARSAIGDDDGARERWATAADVYRRIDAAPHWIERLGL